MILTFLQKSSHWRGDQHKPHRCYPALELPYGRCVRIEAFHCPPCPNCLAEETPRPSAARVSSSSSSSRKLGWGRRGRRKRRRGSGDELLNLLREDIALPGENMCLRREAAESRGRQQKERMDRLFSLLENV